MIPLLDALSVVGLQFINDDGTKKFLTGSKKAAAFFLGQEILKSSDTVYLPKAMLPLQYLSRHGSTGLCLF